MSEPTIVDRWIEAEQSLPQCPIDPDDPRYDPAGRWWYVEKVSCEMPVGRFAVETVTVLVGGKHYDPQCLLFRDGYPPNIMGCAGAQVKIKDRPAPMPTIPGFIPFSGTPYWL